MLIAWSGVWAMDWMKLPQPQPTRCASSPPRETGRPWIRQQLCTWYFNWRTDDFGDESYAKYERDSFGSAGCDDDGSGPAAGVRAAEPTAGFGDAAGTSSAQSAPDKSGDADHDESGRRSRDHAREGSDQVFVAAHSNCGNLSAKPDAGSATGADSAGRSLLSGTHGLERLDRPERLPSGQQRRRHGEASSGRAHKEVQVPVPAAGFFLDD